MYVCDRRVSSTAVKDEVRELRSTCLTVAQSPSCSHWPSVTLRTPTEGKMESTHGRSPGRTAAAGGQWGEKWKMWTDLSLLIIRNTVLLLVSYYCKYFRRNKLFETIIRHCDYFAWRYFHIDWLRKHILLYFIWNLFLFNHIQIFENPFCTNGSSPKGTKASV